MSPDRVFEVMDDECVACNLCVNVCPVDNCITMERAAEGRGRPAHRHAGRRLCQLDDASEQPEREGGGVMEAPVEKFSRKFLDW